MRRASWIDIETVRGFDRPSAAVAVMAALLGLLTAGGVVGCGGGESGPEAGPGDAPSSSSSGEVSNDGPGAGPGSGSDKIRLPDARRVFTSPGGGYALIISTPDGWESKRVEAALYGVGEETEGEGERERLWKRTLPYPLGPRHAAVNDAGEVVLIDEWLNVKSDHAVRVIGVEGALVAAHPYERVREVLGVSGRRLLEAAEGGGWWVAGEPRLSGDGSYVYVPAGGRYLRVRLKDGLLKGVDERG